MTISYPADYYNRWLSDGAGSDEATKGYDEHLLVAGNVGQSSEINEIQSRFKARLRDLGNHLLKDGDITDGGELVITPNGATVTVLAQAATMWLYGAIRSVPQRTFAVSASGAVQVGVWLTETVVSADTDVTLRDPAVGIRLVGEEGASRLKVTCTWGHASDGQAGSFYAVHRLLNGVLLLKKEPPEANAVAQAIARYDRQSAGNSYASSGFRITAIPGTSEELQYYSLSGGVARINGSEVITEHAQTLEYRTTADLDAIDEEQYDSTGLQGQIITVRHPPIAAVSRLTVVKSIVEESVVRSSLGSSDILSKTSIVAVSEVKKGQTTYVAGVNYSLSSDAILWLSGGPNPGETYTVSYTYNKNVTSTATLTADATGVIVPEANEAGTNAIEVGYTYKLPRIDRICLDPAGEWHVIQGVSSRRQDPLYPQIPQTYLALASIYQTWVADTRRVQNDGPRMVSMAKLENHDRDIQTLYELVANNNLLSDLSAREPLGRRGLFTDSFLSDNARDTGIEQSAQITQDQTLTLGVQGTEYPIHLEGPITLTPTGEVIRINQPLSSDAMQINPYLVFTPPRAYAYLNPWWDFWTVNRESVLPTQYIDVYQYTTSSSSATRYQASNDLTGTILGRTTTTTTTTTLVSDTTDTLSRTLTESARYMRETSVRFTLTGWGSNENLVTVKIDGRSIIFNDSQ